MNKSEKIISHYSPLGQTRRLDNRRAYFEPSSYSRFLSVFILQSFYSIPYLYLLFNSSISSESNECHQWSKYAILGANIIFMVCIILIVLIPKAPKIRRQNDPSLSRNPGYDPANAYTQYDDSLIKIYSKPYCHFISI